jgi:aconitate hydratase
VKTVRELEGIKVDQVAIGSCTNSSYRDLMIIANILGGRSIPKTVSSGLAPGSRQVLSMLIENKTIGNFVKSGMRIMEAACGFCFGGTFAPGSGEVSLRTNNRNYKGRSGTADAKVYLVSPETAAASAIMGEITDPRRLEQLGIKYENVVPTFPERFFIDDSMFIFPLPQDEREKVQVIRGPNIKPIPDNTPLQDNLKGVVTIKVGDKITTDHIMPAGQYLKYWSNIPEYSKHTFEIVDTTFYQRAIENRNNGIGNFIVAGESYGQGSSREHAALCPMYLGVKAVIAKSFERMHRTNLANFGIVPLQFIDPNDYNLINQGDKIDLIGIRKKIEQKQDTISLINRSTGKEIKLAILLTDRERNFILEGGLLPYIRRVERTNNSTSN